MAHGIWGRVARVSMALFAALALLVATGWILATLAPANWIEADLLRADPQSASAARDLEQNLAAAIARVRPKDSAWAIRIQENDINAWIVTRLPLWLEHDPSLAWPMDGVEPQLHFSAGSATLSVAVAGRVYSGTFTAVVSRGAIQLTPGWGAIGRLPIPDGAWIATRYLRGAAATTLSVGSIFKLGDGRQVEIRQVDFVEGAIEIEFITR